MAFQKQSNVSKELLLCRCALSVWRLFGRPCVVVVVVVNVLHVTYFTVKVNVNYCKCYEAVQILKSKNKTKRKTKNCFAKAFSYAL